MYWSSSSAHNSEAFPYQNPSNFSKFRPQNSKIIYLFKFSKQVTICQFSFEICITSINTFQWLILTAIIFWNTCKNSCFTETATKNWSFKKVFISLGFWFLGPQPLSPWSHSIRFLVFYWLLAQAFTACLPTLNFSPPSRHLPTQS